MENKYAVVAEEAKEMLTTNSEVIDVVVFDKDAMRRDFVNGLKEFGQGCCEAGKETLAPLTANMVKHLFNWLSSTMLS